jgi:hypothetical protein
MQIQLCEDCMHVARGDDWTIVDQNTAKRVERWQTEHTGCDIVAAFDEDTGSGVEASSRVRCHCCTTVQRGTRYAFRVSWPMVALSCGHEPSPHSEHTTGTVTLPDDREVCWSCGDQWQREYMATHDQLDAYLSSDGKSITTWSGGHLATVERGVSRKTGFCGATRMYLRAVDPTGKRWHGSSPGPGMYARLRKSSGAR